MQTIFIDYLDDGCTGKSNTYSSKYELSRVGMFLFHNFVRRKSFDCTVTNIGVLNYCISVFNPQMLLSLHMLKELGLLSL